MILGNPSSMNCKNKMKYYEGSYWCCSAESVCHSLETGVERPPPIKVRLNYTSNLEADVHTEIVDNNIDAVFDADTTDSSSPFSSTDDDDVKKQGRNNENSPNNRYPSSNKRAKK